MSDFQLPGDLKFNRGLVQDPDAFAKESGSVSWLFLVGDEFASMPGGMSYAQVQRAVPHSARVVSDPPRILTLDLARQHVEALDRLPRPTLVTCRSGPRGSAVAYMYAGLKAGASYEEVLASAERDQAPFCASDEIKTWVRSSMEALRSEQDGDRAQPTPTGDRMSDKPMFITFWTNESTTTRKVLARIPEGSDYRPDPKSRTAHEIAWAIVCEEKMIIEALESGKAEWAPPPLPATMKEVLDTYEKQSAEIAGRWKKLPDARWDGQLDFFGTERPASPMAWSFLFDIVHHRGQISTYLRPMGSTVPQIYGPSGDEP